MTSLAFVFIVSVTLQSIIAVNPAQLKGWQLRGTLNVIKEMELNLKEGEDIKQIEKEVQQKLINEAYFESRLEAARYQDREEIEYYDDDEIPGDFGKMIDEAD